MPRLRSPSTGLSPSQILSSALCDGNTAKLLKIEAGAPLMEINRTAMTYRNTPVELRRSLVNAHEYWNEFGKPDPRS